MKKILLPITKRVCNFYVHFWANAFISLFNTTTMHFKSIALNSIALIDLRKKTLYPGGIRTRGFYSLGGCDVHCTMPPGGNF
jgi:hypothetical protein